jgi:hypothetical protein
MYTIIPTCALNKSFFLSFFLSLRLTINRSHNWTMVGLLVGQLNGRSAGQSVIRLVGQSAHGVYQWPVVRSVAG